jgi:hypothetical protein
VYSFLNDPKRLHILFYAFIYSLLLLFIELPLDMCRISSEMSALEDMIEADLGHGVQVEGQHGSV